MQPTLKDIALDLGVSTATVSNALRGTGRVSPELRARIRERAERAGYRAHQPARALRTGRTGMIGLVVPDLANPLFPKIAQAVEVAATAAGFGVLIADSRGDTAAQTAALNRLVFLGAEGIVVVPRRGTIVREMPCPLSVIDTPSSPINTASADHWQGGQRAAEALVALGHRRLLLIGGHRDSTVQNDRIGGMRSAVPPDVTAATHWMQDGDPKVVRRVRDGVTGIIATFDLAALKAMTDLQRAGFTVPRDASVIGFDNMLAGSVVMPGLTTLAADARQIAEAAVAALSLQIEGQAPPEPVAVPMALIERGSTAPPPRGPQQADHSQQEGPPP
ncbi:MAG: LacI family DNA-binding transcriptional regulator [Pseudomonadota bacterium]